MHPGRRSDEESKGQLEQKKIVYHPEAFEELIEASRYYESCSSGLGSRFLDTIENSLEVIKSNPQLFCTDELGRRKYVVKKFPYLIIFRIKEDCIYILAVAHGRRKPEYWKSRET